MCVCVSSVAAPHHRHVRLPALSSDCATSRWQPKVDPTGVLRLRGGTSQCACLCVCCCIVVNAKWMTGASAHMWRLGCFRALRRCMTPQQAISSGQTSPTTACIWVCSLTCMSSFSTTKGRHKCVDSSTFYSSSSLLGEDTSSPP